MTLLALVLTFAAACSPVAVPTAPISPTVTPPATQPAAAATADTDIAAKIVVSLGRGIHCANFPYSCWATLSVLAAGSTVTDDWRPPATDPLWGPDWTQGTSSDRFDPKLIGTVPRLPPGAYAVVVSVLGTYDTPSYRPDGSLATDLLSRCSGDIEVGQETSVVNIRVTFTPDPQSFRAACTLVHD